jgi:hypothetical protein
VKPEVIGLPCALYAGGECCSAEGLAEGEILKSNILSQKFEALRSGRRCATGIRRRLGANPY